MVFIIFQICVEIVDCFVCLRLYADVRYNLLFNAHVSFAFDETNFFCTADFPGSLRLYL